MKPFHFLTATATALLLTCTSILHAEPLNLTRVPADSKWVAHVDINAAVNSQYGQLAIADMQSLGLQTKLDALKNLLGLDPLKDFDSVTAYGQTLGDKEGTLIVQMGPSIGKLDQIAKLAEEYQSSDYKGYVIHSWIDKQKPGKATDEGLNLAGQRVYCGVMPIAGGGKNLLIFSPDESRVSAAIDQVSANHIAGTLRIAQPSPGSIVFVSAVNLDELAANQPNRPAILKVIKSLTCDIGETGGNAYLSLNVATTDAQQAANLQQMAVGMLAMVKMNEDPVKQPLVDFANKINITVNDSVVNARVQYPSKQLYELVKQLKLEHEKQEQANQQPQPAQ